MDRPEIDYANLPYLPREGIQAGGSHRYLTRSLFLETAPEANKPEALWTMAEHEVFAFDRWIPSAWMVYIHATDEYDALRKLCGNVRQWEHIKGMFEKVGRLHILESWQMEQAAYQRSKLRETLLKTATTPGGSGSTAATKMLLQLIEAPQRGRPKKKKESEPPSAVEEAAQRVVNFQR